jgi:hypothetical protein
LFSEAAVAEAFELKWSARRPRRERRSAEFWGVLRPREILEERRNADGSIIGPYESQYAIANGYNSARDIVQP